MKKFKKVLSVLSTVLLIAATALVVFVFVIRLSGSKPKMFGYYFFNVMSDSMTPMLDVNDVILVKECNALEVHKGDVITYHGTSGELAGKDITHKVIEEPVKASDGTVKIKTQGIKQGALVDPIVTGEQVIGKYVTKLGILSIVFTIFRKWYGLAIFLVILFALIGKDVYNLIKLSKKVDKIEPLSEEQIQQILARAEQKQKEEQNADTFDKTEASDVENNNRK